MMVYLPKDWVIPTGMTGAICSHCKRPFNRRDLSPICAPCLAVPGKTSRSRGSFTQFDAQGDGGHRIDADDGGLRIDKVTGRGRGAR